MNNSIAHAISLINTNYKHILEFGVFQGNSIKFIRDSLDESYKIYGFDSFEGLPEDWENTECVKGFFSTKGVIPNIENVKFFKGWFENTIHEYLKEADNIGLLHVDCDLYSSTKTIFDNLNKYIKSGTIIVFDEWFYNRDTSCNDHEQKAFYEYVNNYNIKFEFIKVEDSIERKVVKIL